MDASNRISRRMLMTGAGCTLVTATGALASSPVKTAAQERAVDSYDRARLERMIDAYLDALVARDPSRAPFARDALFAENDQALPLGEGSWRTIERLGRYRHYFAEPENGLAGVIANAWENGQGCILILTIKLRDAEIAWAEQFVIRDPNGARLYEELGRPDPVWLEPIPPAQRQSREALEAAAWIYFQALERNDGAGVYPFREDCERIEHARRTVRQPRVEGYGHADTAVDFVTLKAKEQYELGMMAFVTRIRDRRAAVVDIERGAVLGQSVWDFDGTLESIHFRDGKDWKIPPYFRTPRTHQVTEAFKVINGSFRYIEMTLMEVPFGTRQVMPGRAPTVSLTYAPTRPPSKPVPTGKPAQLRALTQRILDAMIGNCPCELPLAQEVRYTENGVPVALGEGLWKSLGGVREYGLFLDDLASGQGGWVGTLDEVGLFAALALRYRTDGGRITELEALIARPETEAVVKSQTAAGTEVELKGATFSMFVPPLLADLNPQGFARPDPALLRKPGRTSRPELLRAVDLYYEAFTRREGSLAPLVAGCRRRENGIAASDDPAAELTNGFLPRLVRLRERRTLLADERQGLVLRLALLDNPGDAATVDVPPAGRMQVPASCRAPWTDMHAQLFKVEAGRISHIEGLVRRLPYGQGSGWKA